MNLKRLTFGAVGVAAAAITTVTVIHANSTHDSSVARSPIAVPETQGTGWVSTEDLTGVGLNVNQILHDMGPFPVYSSKAGGKVIAVYYRNGRGVQPLHGSYTDPGVKPMTSSSI